MVWRVQTDTLIYPFPVTGRPGFLCAYADLKHRFIWFVLWKLSREGTSCTWVGMLSDLGLILLVQPCGAGSNDEGAELSCVCPCSAGSPTPLPQSSALPQPCCSCPASKLSCLSYSQGLLSLPMSDSYLRLSLPFPSTHSALQTPFPKSEQMYF